VSAPVLLVVAPMPVFPASAGNRRRLLATCDTLKSFGYQLDFLYVAHEDQIYRRFGQTPPTDLAAMRAYFRRLFVVELAAPIKLKTSAPAFDLDDWAAPEAERVIAAYMEATPDCAGIFVTYVFLSRCLLAAPAHMLRLLDTQDRFADRKQQYVPFRGEANFFHTSEAAEREGLLRADIALAIQPREQAIFAKLTGRPCQLLLPEFARQAPFKAPERLETIGFIGHGNDANRMSLTRFADAWARLWRPALPRLRIAGEICGAVGEFGPAVERMGYVDELAEFYGSVDCIVAPLAMGTGLKIKVVEALSFGKPVIGTGTAFDGMTTTSPDHALIDPEDTARRIAELSGDPRGLAKLTRESAAVFSTYLKDQAAATSALKTALRAARKPIPKRKKMPLPFAALEPEEASTASFGAISVRETRGLPDSPASDDAGWRLFATEFVSAGDAADGPSRLAAAARSPRTWSISLASDTAPAAASPLSGRRVLAAPWLLDPDDPQAAGWAARLLADAQMDWEAAADAVLAAPGTVSLKAPWPAPLLGGGGLRIYLVPAARQPAVAAATATARPLARLSSGRHRASPRCGVWPFVPACLDLSIAGAAWTAPYAGALVLAHGLLGAVRFAPGAAGQ
jgi:hypothetical protein